MLADDNLAKMATKYKKTGAQMMLRWALQHGVVVIPKASSEEHQSENINVFDFEISEEDMATMDTWNQGFRLCEDPESEK